MSLLVLMLIASACGGPEPKPTPSTSPVTPSPSSVPSPAPSSSASAPEVSPTPDPVRFRVASFNVLGAHHTRPGARGPHVQRKASSAVRSRLALRALLIHRVGLVGLQEFEPPQLRQWRRFADAAWRFFPGLTRGELSLSRSIAWRDDTWEVVRRKVFTFPYFKGAPREAPSVVLRHRASGRLIGMINVHNPANTRRFGDNSRWRRQAIRIQIREIRQLRQQGLPVIVTGDFNEVRPAYCAMTRRAGLVAALGPGRERPCRAPDGAGVDWIFGSSDVNFSRHWRAEGELVRRASDHPIVVAAAELPSP